MECRHLDDNPTNNRPDNLRWGTRLENMADRFHNGRKNHLAKLTAENVREIRATHASGAAARRLLADKFGVSRRTISQIVHRRTWRHVA